MHIHHLAQVDVVLAQRRGRFWIDSCGGRDQVAMTVLQQGWQAYEPPLPWLVAQWCTALRPSFLDIGANTGFYSLLALASGALACHAFEPVAEIAAVLSSNARLSEMQDSLQLHPIALGRQRAEAALYFPLADHGLVETSASLNPDFRRQHSDQRVVQVDRLDDALPPSAVAAGPVLVKIDVESHEPEVLTGAHHWIKTRRPAVVCEILPGSDLAFYQGWMLEQDYSHYALDTGLPVASRDIALGFGHRDHLFLPDEQAGLWLAPLASQAAC